MATEPVFFVVERTADGEIPSLCYDVLPSRMTRRIPQGSAEQSPMIYVLRLDRLPDAERWQAMSLADLYSRYCELRDAGKLPPSNLHVSMAKSDPARRLLGDYWEPPVPTWDTTAPFERPPVGKLNPAAPAFIGPAHAEEALKV